MPAKTVPVYQRLTPAGTVRQQVAGAELTLRPGESDAAASAVWLAPAAALGGLTPRVGDRHTAAPGVWWVVAAVGPLADGAYPLTCTRGPE
jgi:hypothetical protein